MNKLRSSLPSFLSLFAVGCSTTALSLGAPPSPRSSRASSGSSATEVLSEAPPAEERTVAAASPTPPRAEAPRARGRQIHGDGWTARIPDDGRPFDVTSEEVLRGDEAGNLAVGFVRFQGTPSEYATRFQNVLMREHTGERGWQSSIEVEGAVAEDFVFDLIATRTSVAMRGWVGVKDTRLVVVLCASEQTEGVPVCDAIIDSLRLQATGTRAVPEGMRVVGSQGVSLEVGEQWRPFTFGSAGEFAGWNWPERHLAVSLVTPELPVPSDVDELRSILPRLHNITVSETQPMQLGGHLGLRMQGFVHSTAPLERQLNRSRAIAVPGGILHANCTVQARRLQQDLVVCEELIGSFRPERSAP